MRWLREAGSLPWLSCGTDIPSPDCGISGPYTGQRPFRTVSAAWPISGAPPECACDAWHPDIACRGETGDQRRRHPDWFHPLRAKAADHSARHILSSQRDQKQRQRDAQDGDQSEYRLGDLQFQARDVNPVRSA